MKKIKFIICIAFSVLLVFISCVKPKLISPAENNIIDRAFPESNFTVTTLANDYYYYEMGFKFTVNQSGKITKLGVKTPDAGTYRVTLWDASNKAILATAQCVHSDARSFTTVAIGNVPLIQDKEYYITFRTLNQKRYGITQKSFLPITYPIQVGAISLKEYGYYAASLNNTNGDVPIFPNNSILNFARGFPEFEFQAD